MKKVFIGLLIIAAGAGTFYFLQKKKTQNNDPLKKELLLGKWKADSLYVVFKDPSSIIASNALLKDSTLRRSRYDFQEGGTFVQTVNESAKADTSYYEWGKKNELLIKDSAKDSTAEIYSVNKLSMDSLVLQSKDSAVFVLTKLRQ
jgi:hypothetical protein